MMARFFYFDLGNVLVRFDHELACRQMAEAAGVAVDVVRRVVFDEGMQWRYERGEITCRQFYDHFCQQTKTCADYDRVHHAASAIFELNAPVAPLVAGMAAAGHRLGVLSNTCAAHWKYCLPRYSLLRLFDVFALSFEIGSMKPDPATYRDAATLAGAAPEEIFFTDDRSENVEAARAAGYDAVLFTTAPALAADLRRRGVEFNY
ncbi:MAG: HAD family phosphatase [Planctomycetes bacterium]|nr:HAD family phosphatase [Planctomycetota bacterium]